MNGEAPMNEPIQIDPTLLPSRSELFRASIVAVLVAFILLITAVLPAEAGIDPTGIGRHLGLTTLGEGKRGGIASSAMQVEPPVGTAAPVVVPTAQPPAAPAANAFRTDELTLVLQPGEGAEIKAVMRAGEQMLYGWNADKGELFFDFHGEAKGAPSSEFTSFEKGSKSTAEGVFEAPFEGTHGWYWKNRGDGVVTVTLKTSGVYESIGRK